ncbi:hypothetical protein HQ585_20280 [candidate division KSB1 bacterium]|nr:hypothetical protein [candidate division KSB1 bacterium]
MFRILLTGLVVYFGYQFIKGFFSSSPKKESSVKGKPKNPPLDLRDADVEDAQFEELDEKGK